MCEDEKETNVLTLLRTGYESLMELAQNASDPYVRLEAARTLVQNPPVYDREPSAIVLDPWGPNDS